MPAEPIVPEVVCPGCSQAVDPAAAICPHCSTSLGGPAPGNTPASVRPRDWTQSPRVLIPMMVFAALFLAFPLLWRSRQISLAGKIFWTLFVTLETVVACWLVWWSLRRLFDALHDHPLW